MAERVEWFARGHYPTWVGFCPSEKAWDREMRRLGVFDEPYPDQDARCFRFDTKPMRVIITLNERLDGQDPVAIVAMLVHEIAHAWQHMQEDMGQRERPGREIEAYALQQLTLYVLDAYRRTRVTSSA